MAPQTAELDSSGRSQPQDRRFDPDFPDQILFPEYAIGKRLITRDEYNELQSQYFTQAQATFGVILPTLLLLFALNYSGVLQLSTWVYIVVDALLVIALIAGMDRLHKFHSELQLLIVGRYDAATDAALAAKTAAEEAAKKDKPTPTLAASLAALKDEIAGLRETIKTELRAPVTIYNRNYLNDDDESGSAPPRGGSNP